jgi:hypothetical protein
MKKSSTLTDKLPKDEDYRCCKHESTLHRIDPVHDATRQSQLGTVILEIYEQYRPFDLDSTLQGTWNRHGIMCHVARTLLIITGANNG